MRWGSTYRHSSSMRPGMPRRARYDTLLAEPDFQSSRMSYTDPT